MIEKKEFRIGNLVAFGKPYVDGRKDYYLVEGLNGRSVRIHRNGHISGLVDYKNVEPIPITPDILLKCGFKDGNVRVVGKPDEIIEWEHEDAEIRKDFGRFEYVLYSDEWGSTQASVEIKYLHQLQNLYFSLTNNELNIEGL